jgi:hypothetical protein
MNKSALTFAVFRGSKAVGRHTITQELVKLGSDPKSHLRLEDERVARMHAVIEQKSPNEVTLIDLGNDSGTFVNGQRVDKCTLRTGDRIRIGDTELVLEASAAVDTQNPFTSSAFAYDADAMNPFANGARMATQRSMYEVPADAAPGTYTYSIIKSAPDVPAEEVELAGENAVEVTVLWGTSVLSVAHLSVERGYAVGEEQTKGHGCDFFLPEEKIGTTRLPLVLAGGRLVIPPNATGWVELPGQDRMTLDQARGVAESTLELSGAHALALTRGARARIELGDFAFQVAAVAAGKPAKRGLAASFDAAMAGFFGGALLSCATVIGAMALFVPALGLTDDEAAERENTALIQQYLSAAAEREELARDEPASDDTAGNEGGTGHRAPGEEGKMGKPTATTSNKAWAAKGPKENPDPHLARARAREEAESFGIIPLLRGDMNAPTSPFGRDTSLGKDEISAQGEMWGDELGESRGTGGLGLSGIGQGGGCDNGCVGVGLGSIGTFGHGSGLGDGQGFGNHGGRLGAAYKPKGAPKMRPGVTTVSGRLPPEVIQRIVRQNYGRFRMCYEQGLSRNPNLEGRVAVRFVIGRDGAVSNVANGGSDLPDSSAVSCVVSAFYGLSFPQPEGGVVTVVYPIMFQPG